MVYYLRKIFLMRVVRVLEFYNDIFFIIVPNFQTQISSLSTNFIYPTQDKLLLLH
jgi:hypothetical protein